MNDFVAELSSSPLLYPQKVDSVLDRVLFIRMDESAYRAASFLDDRILTAGMQAAWAPWAQVVAAAGRVAAPRPLHFIFHTGHVGSTLLSRLIDETGVTLGLREPLPLRTLADMADVRAAQFGARLATLLQLWRRGFARTQAVVLKATSSTGRIAPRLLEASPDAKAVYLNLKAEPYLATLLAGANAMVDLKGFEQERSRRVRQVVGEMPYPASVGELAAMSWLAETLAQRTAVEAHGARVLPVDFEQLLGDVGGTMATVLAHFGLAAPPADIARSPVLARYSKAPREHAYSPQMRAQLLAQARAQHAAEIARGLGWLSSLGTRNPRVAALL